MWFVSICSRSTKRPLMRPESHRVFGGLECRELCVDERPILAMQVGVREVADVVHDHRVVCIPRHGDGHAGPSVRPLEVGDLGQRMLVHLLGVAGEDEDDPVANLHRIARHLEVGHLAAEEAVRDVDHAAFAVVGPAVVFAHQVAAPHLAE